MPKIILTGKEYTATASNHISYTNKEYSHEGGGGCSGYDQDGNCISWNPTYPVYNYPTRQVNATIEGKITSTVTNVLINGSAPVVVASNARETDKFTLPSSATSGGSGNHTNAVATMNGNNKNVYVNGSLLVLAGSTLNTHVSGVNTTLSESNSSSNVFIG